MIRIFSVVLVLAILSGAIYWNGQRREQGLLIEGGNTFDFGQRDVNEILEHTFVLRNQTNQTVRIEEVLTSCACLIAGKKSDLLGQVIKPGKSIPVTLVMSTKGYIKEILGRVSLTASLHESEPSTTPSGIEKVFFEIHAYIPPDVEFVPDKIDFGKVDRDNPIGIRTAQIKSNRAEAEWELERVSDPIFFVEVNEVKGQVEVSIDTEFARSSSSGDQTGFVELRIANSPQDKLFLPLSVELVERLQVDPPFLSFREQQTVRELQLVGIEPFEIVEVLMNGTAITRPQNVPSKNQRLTISLPATEPVKGVIEIKAQFKSVNGSITKRVSYFHLGRD